MVATGKEIPEMVKAVGHPISSLDKVTVAMRQALDAGKTGADAAAAVQKTLADQASGKR